MTYFAVRYQPSSGPPKMLTGASLTVIYKKSFRRYPTSRGRMTFETNYPNCRHNFGRIRPAPGFKV